MEFFVNNWKIILSAVFLGVVCFGIAWIFVKKPKEEKVAELKKWLVKAVDAAEKEFGSGTGKLKLARVYSLFVSAFPALAKLVSLETFSDWVDDALEAVEERLKGADDTSESALEE